MKLARAILFLLLCTSSAYAAEDAIVVPEESVRIEGAPQGKTQSDPEADAQEESDNKVFSEALEKANEIVSMAKRKERVAVEMNTIAAYYLYVEKKPEEAAYFYDHAFDLFKQTGNTYGIAMITYNLGVLQDVKKDKVGACEKTNESLPIAEKAVGNKRYNQKLLVALIAAIQKFNKINCGSGT